MYNIPFLESVSQFAPYELVKVQSSFDYKDRYSFTSINYMPIILKHVH